MSTGERQRNPDATQKEINGGVINAQVSTEIHAIVK